MPELDKNENTETKQGDPNRIAEPVDDIGMESPPSEPGLWERARLFLKNRQQHRPEAKRELAKDRTRSLGLLIGGTVGALLLFIGLFSTPTTSTVRDGNSAGNPNLGRLTTPDEANAPRASITPLLNADVHSDDVDSDRLSPADIQGTSRRISADNRSVPTAPPVAIPVTGVSVPRINRNAAPPASRQNSSDPLVASRLNNRPETATYAYGGLSTDGRAPSRIANAGATLPDSQSQSTSSIVFVRSAESADRTPAATPSAPISPIEMALLPPGTRLLVRLEAAATTAVDVPVVASVEYHYERNGTIVVPAGTKVFGGIQQASPDGYMSVQFHALQMPNGREEEIEAIGVDLDQKPLKGDVSGKNTVKKILSQTLSGIGTVAAYVVGGGGAGLGRSITGETLLRDRVASNIALAGEQELMSAAYSENIAVTLAANTRFYVIVQKSSFRGPSSSPTIPTAEDNRVEVPTVQELRELMDLRREINRMYQESARASSARP